MYLRLVPSLLMKRQHHKYSSFMAVYQRAFCPSAILSLRIQCSVSVILKGLHPPLWQKQLKYCILTFEQIITVYSFCLFSIHFPDWFTIFLFRVIFISFSLKNVFPVLKLGCIFLVFCGAGLCKYFIYLFIWSGSVVIW